MAYELLAHVLLLAAEQANHTAFGGTGYLGGDAPTEEGEADGRARILNVPARVDITVFEPNTYQVVARTWSKPDGSWRVPYLNTELQFTVVATDRLKRANSAIQDWVYPAPMVD